MVVAVVNTWVPVRQTIGTCAIPLPWKSSTRPRISPLSNPGAACWLWNTELKKPVASGVGWATVGLGGICVAVDVGDGVFVIVGVGVTVGVGVFIGFGEGLA